MSESPTDATEYPPEPWFLGGDFAVGVFVVPAADLPADLWQAVPAGARPIRMSGRVVVGVAAARYTPGGVLAYDELLVAIPVLRRGRPAVWIPQIWVTSAVSQAGGRTLWGIPKERMAAVREVRGRRLSASFADVDGGPIASLEASAGTRMPGTWLLPLPTLQRGAGGGVIRSSNRITGTLRLARTSWSFDGPLRWLAGRRPLVSVAIVRAAVVFGAHVER